MESRRYSRQLILPEIGRAGQDRLSAARVLCVGAGGLGSPVTLYLAAAGVGMIGVIDPDRVESSNLQRQILFETADEGEPKVEAARRRLEALNPQARVIPHFEAFSAQNAEALLREYDLVIDGSDNFATRFLLCDAAHRRGIPVVFAAVDRFEGQVALFDSRSGACYRCLYPFPPKARIRNCAESGVLGSLVGVIGTLQAQLALQFLISGGDPAHPLHPDAGRMTVVDLAGAWNFSSIRIPKRADCPTCSQAPASLVLSAAEDNECSRPAYGSITAGKLGERMALISGAPVLLDVRTDEEWQHGHLSGARHWPLDRLENREWPDFVGHWEEVVVYCRSGVRSARAAELLAGAGFISVANLVGGILNLPDASSSG